MRIQGQRSKYEFQRNVYIGIALFVFGVMGAGCASAHKTTETTTTETTVTYPVKEGNRGYLKKTATEARSSETTTTTTETKAGHQSILGSTLHAIGWVIALPFRLVGGLIGWIF